MESKVSPPWSLDVVVFCFFHEKLHKKTRMNTKYSSIQIQVSVLPLDADQKTWRILK